MAEEILKTPKVEVVGWVDLLLLGIVGKVEKSLTAKIPVVSSNGLMGLGIKGIGGAYIASRNGKLAKIAGGALLIDVGSSLADMALNMVGMGAVSAAPATNDMTNSFNW